MEAEITDNFYKAVLNKDHSYEGIFFTCVKTTGIFCRPGCTAKTPKEENVEFFYTAKDAMDHGYRPCKVCKPLELKGLAPDWVKRLLNDFHIEPTLKIKDWDLRKRGLIPSAVRRWFIKNHGMSFHAYQRSLRINNAFGQIRYGDKVIETAYNSGYNSLSGFGDNFKKLTGFPPAKTFENEVITITRILTPLGPMIAGATEKGICLLEFTDRRMLETQFKNLKKYLKAECVSGNSPILEMLSEQITEYYEGKRKIFDLPILIKGTEFQERVWKILMEIPYGKTRTYKQQAQIIDHPKAIRAIGKANGDNRIALIIPCHRVIGSNGEPVGYGGGIWRKKWLLEHEKKNK
ncbi:methylated-DNA--[protein]-cysteine S-methyltransferase [soil metagenome]